MSSKPRDARLRRKTESMVRTPTPAELAARRLQRLRQEQYAREQEAHMQQLERLWQEQYAREQLQWQRAEADRQQLQDKIALVWKDVANGTQWTEQMMDTVAQGNWFPPSWKHVPPMIGLVQPQLQQAQRVARRVWVREQVKKPLQRDDIVALRAYLAPARRASPVPRKAGGGGGGGGDGGGGGN